MRNVDHRQLHLPLPIAPILLPILATNKNRQVDIDHRNLISLTGSPRARDNEDIKYKRTNKTWVAQSKVKSQQPQEQPSQQQQPTTDIAANVDYRVVVAAPPVIPAVVPVVAPPPPPVPVAPASPIPLLHPPPMLTGL